jgi:WD40 repeat protein
MANSQERFERVTRLDVIERSARNGTLHTLLHEIARAAEVLAGEPRGEALERLRAALRIDLAHLVAHPGEAFSTLYNRLVWHEHPRASAYYDLPAGKAAPSVVAARTNEHPLHELLRSWHAQIEARGTCWLRSLRPPEIALGGALLEEYRADAPQYSRRLRLLDHGRLELDHGPLTRAPKSAAFAPETWRRIVWDRTTGSRVHEGETQLFARDVSPDGRYRVQYSDWDEAYLYERDQPAARGLQFHKDHHVSAVAYSEDGRFVALAGYELDGFGFVALYSLPRGVLMTWLDVDCGLFDVCISANGERVAASGRRTYVWDVATQQKLREIRVSSAALAFADHGRQLVTAQLGVVRVWDLERECSALRHYHGGLSHGAFSPDGERLVTGSWLSAARTGELIAHLDFHSREYMEGGPPANATLVGNERAVRLEGGIHVWDMRTGAKLLRDESRPIFSMDLYALHPEGRCYAAAHPPHFDREGGRWVALIDTESGEVLARLNTTGVTSLKWSPDGETLVTGSIDGTVRLWKRGQTDDARVLTKHQGPIADLAFLGDGSHLISAADGEALRVWRLESGALVYERPLAAGDPTVTTWRSHEGKQEEQRVTYYTWSTGPKTLAQVERALDEATNNEPPLSLEQRDGCLVLVDETTDTQVAWFPANEQLIAHPEGRIWAGGVVHVRLEGNARRAT